MANNDNKNRNEGGGRGFSSMDPKKRQEAASEGGKAAHEKGTAHEFDQEQAKEAGRKGGEAKRQRNGGNG